MNLALPLASLLLVGTAQASPPATYSASEPLFSPVLGGSVLGEAGQMEGNIFGVLPITQQTDSILFVQPLAGWQEGGATQASLGLGFRKLFGDPTHGKSKLSSDIDLFGEGWYLGGNVFADWMESARGLDHSQVSAGLELGSRYLSFHANYYWPLSDEKRWGDTTLAKTLGQTRTRGNDYTLHVGPQRTTGPLIGTRDIHATKSPYRITSIREKLFTYGLYEEALSGWDAGLSLLVPSLDKYIDLRLVAGLYGFNSGHVGSSFEGWQVGAELRPVPAVVLMATHFDDNRSDNGEWLVGIRFEIPLGKPLREDLRPRTRSLPERLTEPARRRYSPTVVSGSKLEKTAIRTRTVVEKGIAPSTIEPLQLSFVPMPGDIFKLPDGTFVEVEADGRTLRVVGSDRAEQYGWIAVVPEPSRALLMILGLVFGVFRRRR